MRQKKQHFQKQIRRQTIDKIFKANRQKYFNYTYNDHIPVLTPNLIKDQCIDQFTRYINEIQLAFKQEQQINLYNAVKDSAHFLKLILNKAKTSADCITFIVQNWFNLAFDQHLFETVAMFTPFSQQQFKNFRKQTYRYALEHFYLIFQYESLIQRKDGYEDDMFRFLFLVLAEHGNEPDLIDDIFCLINSIISLSQKARHDFFFSNRFENDKSQNSKNTKICFEHLISAIFQNKEKMSMPNSKSQIKTYKSIKMFFIDFFNVFCSQLKKMEKYIKNCQRVGPNKYIPNSQKKSDDVYQNILELVGFPDQIKHKSFLQTAQIVIIYEVIKEMKRLSYENLSEGPEEEQNLATCLQAFRGLIEFYHSKKILKEFQNQLQFLIERLSSKEGSIILKNEIMNLIDTIVFLDTNNQLTDYLIKSHSLFQRVWSYEDKSVIIFKLNILNNIILSDVGFDVAMRYLSQIYVTLSQTKYVDLALTFCINYFEKTNYSFTPTTRSDLVLDILYRLPIQHFGLEELRKDYYIFSKLYNHGFSQTLPERYRQWKKYDDLLILDSNNQRNHVQNYENQQKRILVENMLKMEVIHRGEGYMEE